MDCLHMLSFVGSRCGGPYVIGWVPIAEALPDAALCVVFYKARCCDRAVHRVEGEGVAAADTSLCL